MIHEEQINPIPLNIIRYPLERMCNQSIGLRIGLLKESDIPHSIYIQGIQLKAKSYPRHREVKGCSKDMKY